MELRFCFFEENPAFLVLGEGYRIQFLSDL